MYKNIGACDDWIDTISVEQPRYLRRNSLNEIIEKDDDAVYGSFAIYQKEIEDELRIWSSNHSKEELIEAVESAIESVNLEEEKLQLQKTWEVILNKI